MIKLLAYFGLHVVLALLSKKVPSFSTFYALGTLVAGSIWIHYRKRDRSFRIVMLAAYIAGCEVLWRMTDAKVFWEYGKYAVVLILAWPSMRAMLQGRLKPLLYFLCLIPSAFIVFFQPDVDWLTLRKQVSFNISGPLALMFCATLLPKQRFTVLQIVKIFEAMLGPIVSIAFLAIYKIRTTEITSFSLESSGVLSGGFGPNQVSAILGLGFLSCFFCFIFTENRNLRLLFLVTGLLLGGQSALTFSRAGMYYATASAILSSLFFIRKSRLRNRLIIFSIILFIAGNFVILPKLNQFTEGALGKRFQNTSLTNREILIKEDLELWKQSPFFGVGLGQASFKRLEIQAASHTEFTRLLAEHGTFGILAIFLLFSMCADWFLKAKTAREKAFVIGMASWTIFFMLGNGMRTVTASFIFGFAGVHILMLPPKPLITNRRSSQGALRSIPMAKKNMGSNNLGEISLDGQS